MRTIEYDPQQHRLMPPADGEGRHELQILGETDLEIGETFELHVPRNLSLAFPDITTNDWYEPYARREGVTLARRVL